MKRGVYPQTTFRGTTHPGNADFVKPKLIRLHEEPTGRLVDLHSVEREFPTFKLPGSTPPVSSDLQPAGNSYAPLQIASLGIELTDQIEGHYPSKIKLSFRQSQVLES